MVSWVFNVGPANLKCSTLLKVLNKHIKFLGNESFFQQAHRTAKANHIIERSEKYVEGWMKDNKIFEKEREEEKVFDEKLTNALANSNVEMAINKNKTMTK